VPPLPHCRYHYPADCSTLLFVIKGTAPRRAKPYDLPQLSDRAVHFESPRQCHRSFIADFVIPQTTVRHYRNQEQHTPEMNQYDLLQNGDRVVHFESPRQRQRSLIANIGPLQTAIRHSRYQEQYTSAEQSYNLLQLGDRAVYAESPRQRHCSLFAHADHPRTSMVKFIGQV
jgi:hypothetical protein